MRTELLKFRDIVHSNTIRYALPGLELIEPFGVAQWNSTLIYCAPSQFRENDRYPNSYAYYNAANRRPCIKNGRGNGCLSEFISEMTDEEQAQFRENIVEIFEILGIK
jgi:hypothetical protein